MKLYRKYAFFLNQAAALYHKLYNSGIAYRLSAMTLHSFDIPLSFVDSSMENVVLSILTCLEWVVVKDKKFNEGWPFIKIRVLRDLTEYAIHNKGIYNQSYLQY